MLLSVQKAGQVVVSAQREDPEVEYIDESSNENELPAYDPMRVVMQARLFLAHDNPKMKRPVNPVRM